MLFLLLFPFCFFGWLKADPVERVIQFLLERIFTGVDAAHMATLCQLWQQAADHLPALPGNTLIVSGYGLRPEDAIYVLLQLGLKVAINAVIFLLFISYFSVFLFDVIACAD